MLREYQEQEKTSQPGAKEGGKDAAGGGGEVRGPRARATYELLAMLAANPSAAWPHRHMQRKSMKLPLVTR